MTERGHRAALDQPYAVGARGPALEPRPGELRAPAELARRRIEPLLESTAQPGFGADAAHQDDLAAGPEHPRELVERRLRVRNRGDHVLRHHDIERCVGKLEMLGI